MIMLRSTHEAQIKELHTLLLSQQGDYHQRIEALEAHIKDLRLLVFPPSSTEVAPLVLEADAVISGSEKPIEVSEKEHNRLLEQSREADLLISGNYDLDLLNE